MVTSAILEVFSRLAVKQLVQDEPQLVAMCTVQLMTMGTSAILEVFRRLALVQSNPNWWQVVVTMASSAILKLQSSSIDEPQLMDASRFYLWASLGGRQK